MLKLIKAYQYRQATPAGERWRIPDTLVEGVIHELSRQAGWPWPDNHTAFEFMCDNERICMFVSDNHVWFCDGLHEEKENA
jgi:hypothetical protein